MYVYLADKQVVRLTQPTFITFATLAQRANTTLSHQALFSDELLREFAQLARGAQ